MNADVAIHDFLGQKRIGIAGVSRDPNDFSRVIFRELLRRSYDVVPIHPAGGLVEGRACFARVQDVTPPLDGVLLMTAPEVTEQVVKDCADAGVTRVWMHRGVGRGAVSARAAAFCRERGIRVVEGACPLMFLRRAGLPHRVHALVLRLFGKHPEQRASA